MYFYCGLLDTAVQYILFYVICIGLVLLIDQHRCLQNLHWKLGQLTPSFGSLLALKLSFMKPHKISAHSGNCYFHFFSRNKTFLFFKIESWNFQHLFEKAIRETSQNLNSIRQLIEKMKITIVWISWMSWNFVRFHEIQFQTDTESFNFLSWKTKKFYF